MPRGVVGTREPWAGGKEGAGLFSRDRPCLDGHVGLVLVRDRPACSASGSVDGTSASAAAVNTWPGVRSGSGSQPDPASSSSARSAISPFLR